MNFSAVIANRVPSATLVRLVAAPAASDLKLKLQLRTAIRALNMHVTWPVCYGLSNLA